MQSVISFGDCRDQVFHVAFRADIGLHKGSFAALLPDSFRSFFSCGINIADYNFRTVPREEQRGGSSYATTAACDQRHLAGEVKWIQTHA